MRLLVSVRDAAETRSALAGGGEIIDAKEPAAGALGPVSAAALRAIRSVVPADTPCSAALGDVASVAEVTRALAGIDVPLSFVKLGFRGIADSARVQELLAAAVAAARTRPGAPKVVAVAYADHARMASLTAAEFPAIVRQAGAAGLLVDTGIKEGGGLFDHGSPAQFRSLSQSLRAFGAFLAVGGSLDIPRFHDALATGAAIVGVRGAACIGGRNGVIDEGCVRRLRKMLSTPGEFADIQT